MELKKIVLLAFVLVLLSMSIIWGFIRPVEALDTIYIKADGSVDPDTAPISSVNNVTYTFTGNINEPIVVERDNIVVDGAGYTLQGTGSGTGIDLRDRSNVTIKNMEIATFGYGLCFLFDFFGCSNNTICGNNITANVIHGIYGIGCSNNTICGNNIGNNGYGIWLDTSSSNTISGNNIANNGYGILLFYSANNNTISRNNVTANNEYGILLDDCAYTKFYHNNIINNTQQCWRVSGYENSWDNGVEGNYWSNYTGVDLLDGGDGIGDSPHVINVNNKDNYPLMGMFCDFKATPEYHVQTISNSSISDFQFNGTAICFNVTGENDTTDFCRICIPRVLMNETYQVFVNSTEVPYNLLPCSNSTHSYLYFTYNLSTQEVVIIPEFSPRASLLLILLVLTIAIAVYKRRLLKTPNH